ncbi:MAG: radical SAM protein [Candidatus Omnitrophota bacterium]
MSLDSLYINPTKYCNLCCKHCWVSPPTREKLEKEDEELSIKEIISVVKEARKLGLNSVKLTGGEPLLREDVKELLEFCASSGVETMIETNGTLITKDTARMFKKFKVGHISVSLDSASARTHDFFRGKKGAFKSTIKGIENLRDECFPPQVIMSLYKGNLEGFSDFMRLMRRLEVNDIKINTISPLGRGAGMQDKGLTPTAKEILEFGERLKEITGHFKGSVYLDVPMAFRSLEELDGRGCGCCKIKSILGILSDGSVSICGIGYMDDRLVFGNIKDDPAVLKEIWNNNPVLRQIREKIPSKLEGVCGMCVFKKMCLGNCRAEVYHNTGSFFSPYWFCQEAFDEGLFPSTRLIPEALRT